MTFHKVYLIYFLNRNQLIKNELTILLKCFYNYLPSKSNDFYPFCYFYICNFSCARASILLQTDQDIKHNWTHAVRWLRDQFEVKEI